MRRGRLSAGALALAALAAAVPAGAAAQEEPAAPPEVRLVVTALTGVTGPGTLPADATDDQQEAADRIAIRVLVENTGSQPVGDLRLSVEVFESIDFRSTVPVALDLDDPRSQLQQLEDEFLPIRDGAELAPGDIAGLTFAASAGQIGMNRGSDGGVVFPVRLSVVQGIDALDQVTTSIIHLREPVSEPLATIVGWPLDEQPWRRARGTYSPGVDAAIEPGGRLDRLLRAVEAHGQLPLTLLPGPHVLEDLADRADGFESDDGQGAPEAVPEDDPRARRAAGFLERLRTRLLEAPVAPVVAAYADADVAALAQAPSPLDAEAASAVARGRLRLAEASGRAPQVATYWANTALDRSTLDVLANQTATERLLLPFSQLRYRGDLDSYPEDVPGPLIQLASTSGRNLLALVPDPYVDRALRDPDTRHGPIVAAQRVLAETAVLWTERPLTPRPLVLLPPRDWDPFGRFADQLLTRLAGAPWLRVAAVEELDALAVGRGETASLPTDAGSLEPSFLTALLAARRELAAVQQALPEDADGVAGRAVPELELQLLRAPSAWFVGGGLGHVLVDDVRRTVQDAYGEVAIAEGARITLTSDSGQIPVTVQRPSGGPLEVRISIEGEAAQRANLDWPDGREKTVTLPGTGARTYSFAVRARSTGSFSVDVEVTDPAGVRELARGTITIRSTAISGPALTGTAVVVVLLLFIGLARRQGPDRPKLEVVG